MGTTVATTPMLGKDISLYAGLLNSDGSFPTSTFTVTINNTVDVNATDTSITVNALGGEIPAGTYLTFVEPTSGALKTVYVTATAAAGATSLGVGDGNSTARNGVADAGSPVDIEDGSTAVYPPELYDAVDSSENNSQSETSALTYNSGGAEVKIAVSNSFSLSVPLEFDHPNNGAARTLARAGDSLAQVGFLKIFPTMLTYSTGEKIIYKGNVTATRPSAAADTVKREFTFNVIGLPTRIEPK
jgi:hypothetical protein